MKPRLLPLLTVIAVAVAAMSMADAEAGPARPDLVVAGVTASPATAGGTFAVRVKARNKGPATARASRVTASLGGASVGAKVSRLKKRRSATVVLTLPAPAAGSWPLTVCVDSRKRVKERSERNNCRVTTVLVAAGPGGGAATAPPSQTPTESPTGTPTDPPVPPGLLAAPAPIAVAVEPGPDPATTVAFTPGTAATVPAFPVGSGTTLTFSVPDQTFVEPVTLSASAVSVTGHPFTAVLGAGLVTPDVLTEQPFSAQFDLAAAIDPATTVAFTADADGTDLRLAPVDAYFPTLTSVNVVLMHTGIVGLATATPAQVDALRAAWPTDPDQQAEAALAASLHDVWRARHGTGDLAAARIGLAEAAGAVDAAVLTPALAAAQADLGQAVRPVLLAREWLAMVANSVDDDTALLAPALDARFDEIDVVAKELIRAQGAVTGSWCSSHGGMVASVPFVMGAVRRLAAQGDTALSGQAFADAGLGSMCAVLVFSVKQKWEIHQTGTTTIDDTGELSGGACCGSWSVAGWSADGNLDWASYSRTETTGCPMGSISTSSSAAAGSRFGLRLQSYRLTPTRDGGALPFTVALRLYASNGDPDGTLSKPTVTSTTVTACSNLPVLISSPTTGAAPDLPLDDPKATGLAGGLGGVFTLDGGYGISHAYAGTATAPVAGGSRTTSQELTITLQPT